MARRDPIKVGIALAVVLVITCAQADDCRSGCRGASQTFKYQDGTTYKYTFDSKVEVTLSSAEGQKTLTEIKGQVLLTQQPQCNQILRVQNLQVLTDGKKYGNIPDIEKPIRLNFQDGRLEDSICVVQGDTQNSLNVKRAIASLFQANLVSGHETDVFGLCPTQVDHHNEGPILVIQKTRALNRCAYRESIRQDFLATAFNINSEIKSSPVLNGDYSAKLRVKNGILDQATVSENYLYVPFSVGTNGAKVTVETTLKYTGTSKDNSQVKVSTPRSIIFEDPHPVNSPKSNINSILAAVKETAKTVDVTVGDRTAEEFVNLIRILRVSSKNDLLAVYNQVKAGVGVDKATGKKIFLDALLRAGNGDNIEVAIELLKNKELGPVEQKLVFLGLSFARHVTEPSIDAAVALLNQQNLREAYLGIGALAGRFCRQHSCQKLPAIAKLSQKLLQKIDTKITNKETENNVIFSLKALANIKHFSDEILPKITALAQNKALSNRVRVAALESYLADPCKDKLRDSALSILKDIQQDSEIRIRAYLSLAQCPTPKVATAIKTLLETEPSYQVGGFIVSHIRNIKSSANPDKELAKQHLGFLSLPKRFPIDPRKWSLNSELSYSFDTLGAANSLESNVIYSQNSYLPRSTSLNLTTEVFGHTFNFLEIEARQENLDRLVEHYLGPKGLLRDGTIQELWTKKGEHAEQIVERLKDGLRKSLRLRRDVTKAEIDNISKQVQIKTNELNKDLDLDLSLKAFGSEVLFLNLNEDVKKFTPEAIVDRIVDEFNKGLDRIKNFQETFRSNILFLDAELAYPTSAGFPLRLGVEGASNVQVKASGNIDVPALLKQDSTLRVSVIPSANIQVAGRLTLDALVVENGLKVISNLHTSTGGDLTVEIKPNGVDVKLSLPVQKQDLISAKHVVVFHTRELGTPEHNRPLKFTQNKDFSICLDQLSNIIGLTFCGEFNGPNFAGKNPPVLPFPLAGDAKASITIEREDISVYHYKHVTYTTSGKLGGEILLETLDKNGKEKVTLQVEGFLVPEKYVKANLKSPIANGLAEARIIATDKEKSAFVRVNYQENEYFGKIGVGIEGSPQRAVYKPIIQYKTPQTKNLQTPPYRIEGQLIAEQNGPESKYTFDNVKFVIPNQKTISINGNLGSKPETVYADLKLSDGTNSGSIKGQIQANPNLAKYNVEVKNTLNPGANFHVKGELSKQNEGFKHHFQVIHGQDLSTKTNILTIDNVGKYRNKGPQDFFFETENKINYPLFEVKGQVDLEIRPEKLKYEIDAQYRDYKGGSEFEFEHKKKPEGVDYKLEFSAHGLNNRVELKSHRKVKGDNSDIENSLEVNGKKLEVNGNVRHHVRPQDIDVGADLVIKTPTHNNPFKVQAALKLDSNDLDISHKISSGGTTYIDLFLKANRAGSANGSIKVALKEQLSITGQIKANKGSGNGDLTVELPAVKRVTKSDVTFTIANPTYNVELNIYPIFNEDKTKKITLSTTTKATPQSLDSKNFIDIIDHKLEVNIKGTQSGDFNNGKTNGEVEVILPNQHYIAAKFNRNHQFANNVRNGNVLASLEHRDNKNTPGAKLTLKGVAKNTNFQEGVFDLDYNLVGENGNGKALDADVAFTRIPKDSNGVILTTFTSKVAGSFLTTPIQTKATLRCEPKTSTFNIEANLEPQLPKVQGQVKVGFNEKKIPIDVDFTVSAQGNGKIFTSLKLNGGGGVTKGESSYQIKGRGSIYVDTPKGVVDFQGDGEVRVGDKEGRVKGSFRGGKVQPLTFDTGYSVSGDKDTQTLKGDVALTYGNNQQIKGDATLARLPSYEYKIDANLNVPTQKYKQNRLEIHTRRNEDNSHHESQLTLTSDGRKWTLDTDLQLSETTPSLHIKGKTPEGKLGEVYAKITKIGYAQFGGELRLVNEEKNFIFDLGIDANAQSIEDFLIKINIHSPTLKLEKVLVEANAKPAKTGKRIQVNAKSGGKTILAGSTSYTTREERGKLIVEGSGSFKVKDETKSANFKYIRQNLNQDGETGLEISLDAALGNEAIDAEVKVTNKQFRVATSFCEEKKQCAHVEIDAKTIKNEINEFNNEVEVAIDLRRLGLSHEFGLKAVTNRKGYILDHTVDVHFQSQENSKYQYSIYFHPREAGATLTTPKRVISLESNVKVPENILQSGGKISGEAVLYLDKLKQPNQKSGLLGWAVVNPNDRSFEGEVKFTNPALKRPLVVSGNAKYNQDSGLRTIQTNLNLDIFAQANQKIVLTAKSFIPDFKTKNYEAGGSFEIKSQGLNINIKGEESYEFKSEPYSFKEHFDFKYQVGSSRYDSTYSFAVSTKQLEVLVRGLNIDFLKLSSKFDFDKEKQIIDSDYSIYASQPINSRLELKNFNTLKYTIARKNNPSAKLQVNAGFIPGQIADFRAEIVKGGSPQELVHATVKLDEANFLKSDYGVQSKNIQELFLKPLKAEVSNEVNEFRKIVSELIKNAGNDVKQLGEVARKAAPDLTPLKQYYQTEVGKIKDEIISDKTIKDISEFLHNVLAAVSHALGEVYNNLSQLIESIAKALQTSFSTVLESIEKDLLPRIKEITDKLLQTASQIVDKTTDILLTYLAKLTEIAEKYQPELKQLGAIFGQVTQDLVRFFVKAYERLRGLAQEQYNNLYNELKALPLFEQIKLEYEHFLKHGLPSKEGFVATVKDVFSTVKDIVPTPELKTLIEEISQYIQKKLSNQKVDDFAAIDHIFKTAVKAAQALIKVLTDSIQSPEVQKYSVPLPVNLLNKLPRLTAARFSPLSYLLRGDIPDVSSLVLSLVNHPRNWIPPFPLYGIIAQGQHIFTFDGKHLTFPGKCNYLIASDAVDGNFSVVGTYENGLLTAISLKTQKADIFTIKNTGKVLLNNAVTELPARKPHLAAFRDYERIVLTSDFGVRVICGPQLFVCSVTLSGFYHGRTRGLLGNGNNDPFDDFTSAAGKIVSSESEFGNSYKTGSACPAVEAVAHHAHHPSPGCEKLFNWESNLALCYPFVDNTNYKTACEHGTATGVKDTEFAVAVAYVAACNQHGIPISVPSKFIKCENGDTPREVGETFSQKLPAKAADIVVLVDTVKKNEVVYKEYIQPLIQQITNELHSKGIDDVDFHLIAYGGDNHWPSHTTVNGKLTFKGKAPALKFAENPKNEGLVVGHKEIDRFFEVLQGIKYDVDLAFGQNLQAQTFERGYEYPFRANAVKSIIAVTGNSCQVGRLFPIKPILQLQLLRTLLFRNRNIHISLITPFEKFVAKDAKHTKEVVGFNKENVFTTASKKKGGSELLKELDYVDYCVDFTVNNGGNVFVLDNFQQSKGAVRKQFVQVTSHSIVEQLTSVEEGVDCQCSKVTPFTARNACNVVYVKDRAGGKTKTK